MDEDPVPGAEVLAVDRDGRAARRRAATGLHFQNHGVGTGVGWPRIRRIAYTRSVTVDVIVAGAVHPTVLTRLTCRTVVARATLVAVSAAVVSGTVTVAVVVAGAAARARHVGAAKRGAGGGRVIVSLARFARLVGVEVPMADTRAVVGAIPVAVTCGVVPAELAARIVEVVGGAAATVRRCKSDVALTGAQVAHDAVAVARCRVAVLTVRALPIAGTLTLAISRYPVPANPVSATVWTRFTVWAEKSRQAVGAIGREIGVATDALTRSRALSVAVARC